MAEDTPPRFSPEEEERFDKGVRQIQYEKHLAESNDWMSELSLETLTPAEATVTPAPPQPEPVNKPDQTAKVVDIKRKQRFRLLVSAAASIVLLLTAFYFLQPGSSDTEQYALAAKEAFSTPELLASRGGNTCLDGAVEQYVQGSFDQTRIILGKCGYDNPNTRFLLGLLALQKGDYAAAVPHLTFARNQPNGLSGLTLGPPIDAREVSRADVDWYLALAYLGGGEVEQGRALLDEIAAKEGHLFSREAEQLNDKFRVTKS